MFLGWWSQLTSIWLSGALKRPTRFDVLLGGHLESYSHGSCRRYTVPTKTDIVHTLTILKSGLSWNRFGDCGWKCARKRHHLVTTTKRSLAQFLVFKFQKNLGVCQVCRVRYPVTGTSARIPSPAWWTSGRGGDLCLHHPAFRSAHVPGRSQWQHPVALCDGSQRRGPVGDTAGDCWGHFWGHCWPFEICFEICQMAHFGTFLMAWLCYAGFERHVEVW